MNNVNYKIRDILKAIDELSKIEENKTNKPIESNFEKNNDLLILDKVVKKIKLNMSVKNDYKM